ncbi:hypothetical protein EB796_021884 [Bugula neritina]|uniref:Uncharacterized protein n=1 Tax=Bugula neritina TaxID=10212 RepID=A0A7J7J278_BUGNE|nr:hypothetical protein EB796_021884 [Bugula neritina]
MIHFVQLWGRLVTPTDGSHLQKFAALVHPCQRLENNLHHKHRRLFQCYWYHLHNRHQCYAHLDFRHQFLCL